MKKQSVIKLIIVLIFLISSSILYSQQEYKSLINSYENSLNAKTPDSAFIISKKIYDYVSLNYKDSTNIIAGSILRIGDLFYRIGSLDSAISYYKQALELTTSNSQFTLQTRIICLHNIGVCYFEEDKPEIALNVLLSASDLLEKNPLINYNNSSYLFELIGRIYYIKFDYLKALDFAFKQKKYLEGRNESESDSYYSVLQNISATYKFLNRFEDADSIYTLLNINLKKNKNLDSSYYASFLIDYAKFKNSIDEPTRAAEILKKIDFDCVLKDTNLLCAKEFALAMSYNGMGKIKEAVEIYEKMLQNQNLYPCIQKVDILANLGVSYFSLGEIKKAEESHLLSLSVPTHYEDSATTFYNLSLVKCFQSKNNEALSYIDSALTKTRSDLMRAQLYALKSECHLELKDSQTSLVAIDSSLSLYKKHETASNYFFANALAQKATLLASNGEYNKAKSYLSQALHIYITNSLEGHAKYTSMLAQMAVNHFNLKEYDSVNLLCVKIISHIKENIVLNFAWLSTNEKNNLWALYESTLKKVVNLIIETKNVNTNTGEILYNQCLVRKSILLENFTSLASAVSKSSDKNLIANITTLRDLRLKLIRHASSGTFDSGYEKNLKIKIDSLDKYLVQSLGEYAISKNRFQIEWKGVKAKLKVDEAAIEYVRYFDTNSGEYKYAALVIRKNYKHPLVILQGAEVRIQEAIADKDFSELYKLVWSDIDSVLLGVNKLFISPEGELNNVPFSALYSFQNNHRFANKINSLAPNWKPQDILFKNHGGRLYLMDRYVINLLTTTRYLADNTLLQKRVLNRRIVLVGGVDYNNVSDVSLCNSGALFATNTMKLRPLDGYEKEPYSRSAINSGDMPYLSGTLDEVEQITSRLKKSNWDVSLFSCDFALEQCLKNKLEARKPSIIHIATHGFAFVEIEKTELESNVLPKFDYKSAEDPMTRCGLMLSGSNISWTNNPLIMLDKTGEDGILTSSEVANLDLSSTSLVVLSACKSGVGKIEGSEGAFGLNRGFKQSGVEQLIVSLWNVPDKETMELMNKFYSYVSQGHNMIYSFNQAQYWMRTRYPDDPELWAGFIFIR